MTQPNPEIERELEQLKTDLGLIKRPTPSFLVPASEPKITRRPKPAVASSQRFKVIPWNSVKVILVTGGILTTVVFIANLPLPFIRQGVERTVPILLLPSYLSWDYNYRQAMPMVEEANQLINAPTTFADLDRAESILARARGHVDALPVIFPSHTRHRYYYPWYRVSYDQFEQLRRSTGQMEAKLFQEQQNRILLSQAEADVKAAKEQFVQALSSQQQRASLSQWATALNTLKQISPHTLAGQLARTKLELLNTEFASAKQNTALSP